jgi:hypothetical protein
LSWREFRELVPVVYSAFGGCFGGPLDEGLSLGSMPRTVVAPGMRCPSPSSYR